MTDLRDVEDDGEGEHERAGRRRYRVIANLEALNRRLFKSKAAAEKYLSKMEARLKEANKVCDGTIWTSIELIYLTRWDCPTVRLAAALLRFN